MFAALKNIRTAFQVCTHHTKLPAVKVLMQQWHNLFELLAKYGLEVKMGWTDARCYYKKIELMLTRCAKAYSNSGSVV